MHSVKRILTTENRTCAIRPTAIQSDLGLSHLLTALCRAKVVLARAELICYKRRILKPNSVVTNVNLKNFDLQIIYDRPGQILFVLG